MKVLLARFEWPVIRAWLLTGEAFKAYHYKLKMANLLKKMKGACLEVYQTLP